MVKFCPSSRNGIKDCKSDYSEDVGELNDNNAKGDEPNFF